MVFIEILGFITDANISGIQKLLNTYSTFDVYGSIQNKTILFQSRDLDFNIADNSLTTIRNSIGNIINIKSIEKISDQFNSSKNTIIYIRT